MRDRRCVDDLSIEELERVLLIKRREARLARLRQRGGEGHGAGRDPLQTTPPPPTVPPVSGEGGDWIRYRSVEGPPPRRRLLPAWLSMPMGQALGVRWRFVLNGVLFCVEVAAIVGLVVISMGMWRDQAQISAEAQALVSTPVAAPTRTPTPTPLAVVLPGGHTPPDAHGFSRPDPLPAGTPAPPPTRGPEHATRLVIPSIGVNHQVVEGDDWEALKQGVGHTPWSANPGEVGNCVLTAHNDIFGQVFRRLPDLALKDEVFVYTGEQVYRYVVKEVLVVTPDRTDVMAQTDRPVLTLISSYPYLVDDKRIVVVAEIE